MGNKPDEPEFTIPEDISFGEGLQSNDDASDMDIPGMDTTNVEMAELLVAAQEENAQLKDRLLRTVADMENLRKRTQREVRDARAYAIADFARDMLNATDNLSRALGVIPEDFRTNADAQTKSLIEGIEMTDREMQRLMQKNGVKPILAEGEKFNPHKHQAMFEVPNPDVPAGIVVQVVQMGFEIGDRVLRPAMVGVSKGGPKIAPQTSENQPDPERSAHMDENDFSSHVDKEA
ncbi:Heat shock protein GrpE [hydrothermal vent metagenome]|uniref:Heat shock protein GrpE n=1 Tax=hydrothermal vent metagenome TaxID=652676 RepID=A0A3B0U369_9ZZZZ